MTHPRTEAREYVAGLNDKELAAMLGRQLSVQLRAAAIAEEDERNACQERARRRE